MGRKARMKEINAYAYNILVRRPGEKTLLTVPRRRWEDIRSYFQKLVMRF